MLVFSCERFMSGYSLSQLLDMLKHGNTSDANDIKMAIDHIAASEYKMRLCDAAPAFVGCNIEIAMVDFAAGNYNDLRRRVAAEFPEANIDANLEVAKRSLKAALANLY